MRGRVSGDSRTPTSQPGEVSLGGDSRPPHDHTLSSHWGCISDLAGPFSGKTPGAFWGQRSPAVLSPSLERTASLCPPCTPSTSTRPLADRLRAQDVCCPPPQPQGSAQGGAAKLAGALPPAPPATRGPTTLPPSTTKPFSRAGSPSLQTAASAGPARTAHTCPLAKAPLNGPHGGPPARVLLLHPDPSTHHSGFSSSVTFSKGLSLATLLTQSALHPGHGPS